MTFALMFCNISNIEHFYVMWRKSYHLYQGFNI
jgi:hypothetical protein